MQQRTLLTARVSVSLGVVVGEDTEARAWTTLPLIYSEMGADFDMDIPAEALAP